MMRVSCAFTAFFAALVGGCATAPHTQVITPRAEEVQVIRPSVSSVRLVQRRPARDRYAFVGRVRAVAHDEEFVEAARRVNEMLQQKARALGAEVVKIDLVRLGERDHLVVLAGRAYRALN
jgi:hypothetical protein